jgi:glycine/D-amino acid oxidase-like deaminating enzyme
MQAGKTIRVVDEARPFTASKVASGVINPVTGRRIVRTWRIEELLPFALYAYKTIGTTLGEELVQECSILDFHPSVQMQQAFVDRLSTETTYLRQPQDADEWKTRFNFHFGVGEIAPCLLVDMATLLLAWRKKLEENNLLVDDQFSWSNCTITETQVHYQNIIASKIICCEGVAGFDNPYFKNLPYSRMKGEALIISIPGLPRNHLYKQGLNIVPWKDDLFWVGSSYEWDFEHVHPTPGFRQKVEAQLAYWLKLPFAVVEHLASERPANMERRPFVGLHPAYPIVGILNGMGAKGCSLAPFFAKQLADHLVNGAPLYPDADVRRFAKSLARHMQ